MDYKTFRKTYGVSGAEIALEVYLRNQDAMQIKKAKTAVLNLEKIFSAVFDISTKKGFQAMSMRALSTASGLSLGALYAYFPSKEKLLEIIQTQGWAIIRRDIGGLPRSIDHPWDQLKAVIKAHVFLSEMYRPWFYFTFMEARHIRSSGLESVKSMEAYTQKVLTDILEAGQAQGVFAPVDVALTASMIKAMQQEWYLKPWKYRQLKVGVDAFADHLVAMVGAFCRVETR